MRGRLKWGKVREAYCPAAAFSKALRVFGSSVEGAIVRERSSESELLEYERRTVVGEEEEGMAGGGVEELGVGPLGLA